MARLLLAWLLCGGAQAAGPDASPAAALQARYVALAEPFRHNQFNRPLYLESSEHTQPVRELRGDVYALVDHPFATVSAALKRPDGWCDVLILHLNTKYCRATADGADALLKVSIGKKYSQPVEEAYPIDFIYRVEAARPDYLDIQLHGEKGPMNTSNYRIRLQAVPVENGQTFLHMTYSCEYGLLGQLAMQTYLGTVAGDKVGFTRLGEKSDGQPEYIGGMRGLIERNTMRYYLAIDAYLGSLDAPLPAQFMKRLQTWFADTEQYPRQLHELSREAYIDMKQAEYLRQQAVPEGASRPSRQPAPSLINR